jgi:uncharacterized phage-associated protein
VCGRCLIAGASCGARGVWLGPLQYFTELVAEEARRLFDEFVQVWNEGKLTMRLYKGITVHGRR